MKKIKIIYQYILSKINKSSKKLQKGFTLIELVLYMGILTILIGVLSALFGAIVDVQIASSSTSRVDQDGRYLLSRLAYDMKRADAIMLPLNPGDPPTDTLQINIDSVNYTYSLDTSGNLQMVNDIGTNFLNSSGTQISGLEFTRIGVGGSSDTIRIKYTITSRAQQPSGAETRDFQTTLGLQ